MSFATFLLWGPNAPQLQPLQFDNQLRQVPITQGEDSRTHDEISRDPGSFNAVLINQTPHLTLDAPHPVLTIDMSSIRKSGQKWDSFVRQLRTLRTACIVGGGAATLLVMQTSSSKIRYIGLAGVVASVALVLFTYRRLNQIEILPFHTNYSNLSYKINTFRFVLFQNGLLSFSGAQGYLPGPVRNRAAEFLTEKEQAYLVKQYLSPDFDANSKDKLTSAKDMFAEIQPDGLVPTFLQAFIDFKVFVDIDGTYGGWFYEDVKPLLDPLFECTEETDETERELRSQFSASLSKFLRTNTIHGSPKDVRDDALKPILSKLHQKLDIGLAKARSYLNSKAYREYRNNLNPLLLVQHIRSVVEEMSKDLAGKNPPDIDLWLKEKFDTLRDSTIKNLLIEGLKTENPCALALI